MARGYLLLLGAHLPPQRLAVVLAASSRSYKERDVASAMRTTFPNGTTDFGQQQRTCHAHVVDDEEYSHLDIEALMTGLQEDEDENDIPDESEAIESLVTWRDQRNNISKEQLARGFGPKKSDIKNMAKRARCYNCDEVGHFSRDCKKPKRQRRPPPRDGKGKGK
eukprot:4473091-Pyramimonas_sp.AAC.1